MKSFVLIPLILVAFVSVLSAIPNGGMVFGIGSVGFTGSDVTNSENAGIDYANKIGFYGGVFFKSQSTNDFLLRTEVTLTERGSNVTFDDYDGLSGSMNLWYLSVPLTFMYNFPAVKSPNFYMGVGPALNIAISGTEKVTDGTDTASGEITDQMNPIVLGYQLCAGLNSEKTYVELRYDRQITKPFHVDDEYNEDYKGSNGNIEMYNNGFWILVGIKFNNY